MGGGNIQGVFPPIFQKKMGGMVPLWNKKGKGGGIRRLK